jgi:GDP-D-mannose dehydratase
LKRALITGITGQDGAYLAELLLAKGYEVHGIKRRASSFNTQRIDHLYTDPHEEEVRFRLHYGDLTDATNLIRIIQEVQPDEIYNLAAQSHVMVSFETPEYTANADALGTLRLLEAIRILGLQEMLCVGSLDARRDWGHARDCVRMMWMMLQQPAPEDYVVATGHQHSVRELIEVAAGRLGMRIGWEGKGVAEKGFDAATGKPLVAIDPRYFRIYGNSE